MLYTEIWFYRLYLPSLNVFQEKLTMLYPLNDPGVVTFRLTKTFIILPITSYNGPDSSLSNFPSYFFLSSSLKRGKQCFIVQK